MAKNTHLQLTAAFFYNKSYEEISQSLLGKVLVCKSKYAVITELELYTGSDDPASHAFRGQTKRNWPMFGQPGLLYTYFIYGMHTCANIVIGKKNAPAAVLIRSIVLMPDNRSVTGPGRVCRELGITLQDNGLDLLSASNIRLEDWQIQISEIEVAKRVGITKAQEKLWKWKANPTI